MKPLVSVVIPNHNYAAFVGDAVRSVLAQTYRPLEVIVVDNGSTDHSLAVLAAFGGAVKVVAQENRGQSGARNRGVEESRGEWIAFCDADDVWSPDKIRRQMALTENPKVGIVTCAYKKTDASLRPLGRVMPRYRGDVLERFARGVDAVFPGGESCVLVRRRCFEELGGFDPTLSISAGFDMYRRIAQSWEADFVPEALAYYRQHGSNASRRIDAFERDILAAIGKMFGDPGASRLRPFRRECYARTHLSLAGAYWGGGAVAPALAHLARGLLLRPTLAARVLGYPMRVLARAGGP